MQKQSPGQKTDFLGLASDKSERNIRPTQARAGKDGCLVRHVFILFIEKYIQKIILPTTETCPYVL